MRILYYLAYMAWILFIFWFPQYIAYKVGGYIYAHSLVAFSLCVSVPFLLIADVFVWKLWRDKLGIDHDHEEDDAD